METSVRKLIIIYSENNLEAKQNETQLGDWLVTEVIENYRNEEVSQSPPLLAKAPAVIENHRD